MTQPAQTTKAQQDKGIQIFGDSQLGQDFQQLGMYSLGIGALTAIIGYLHRKWGRGASEQSKKALKNIPHTVTVGGQARKQAADPLYSVAKWAVPVAAGVIGYRLGTQLEDTENKLKVKATADRALKKAEKEYNEVLFSKLYPEAYEKRKKELSEGSYLQRVFDTAKAYKNKVDKKSAKSNKPKIEAMNKHLAPKVASGSNENRGWLDTLQDHALGVVGLAAMMLFGTSYYASKKYHDSHDKNRAKAEELRKALDERAMKRWVPKLELSPDYFQEELKKDKAIRTGIDG